MIATETSILMSVVGMIGIIGSIVILSYGYSRNGKYETLIAKASRKSVAEVAAEENAELF